VLAAAFANDTPPGVEGGTFQNLSKKIQQMYITETFQLLGRISQWHYVL